MKSGNKCRGWCVNLERWRIDLSRTGRCAIRRWRDLRRGLDAATAGCTRWRKLSQSRSESGGVHVGRGGCMTCGDAHSQNGWPGGERRVMREREREQPYRSCCRNDRWFAPCARKCGVWMRLELANAVGDRCTLRSAASLPTVLYRPPHCQLWALSSSAVCHCRLFRSGIQ